MVHRSPSLNRADWENLVVSGTLVSPFAIVETGEQKPDDWGTSNQAFRQSVTITYVCQADDPNAAIGGNPANGYDATVYVLNKLHTLRTTLLAYNSATPGLQLAAKHPSIDVSEKNVANEVFYRLQASKFGGRLTAELLVGDSPIN